MLEEKEALLTEVIIPPGPCRAKCSTCLWAEWAAGTLEWPVLREWIDRTGELGVITDSYVLCPDITQVPWWTELLLRLSSSRKSVTVFIPSESLPRLINLIESSTITNMHIMCIVGSLIHFEKIKDYLLKALSLRANISVVGVEEGALLSSRLAPLIEEVHRFGLPFYLLQPITKEMARYEGIISVSPRLLNGHVVKIASINPNPPCALRITPGNLLAGSFGTVKLEDVLNNDKKLHALLNYAKSHTQHVRARNLTPSIALRVDRVTINENLLLFLSLLRYTTGAKAARILGLKEAVLYMNVKRKEELLGFNLIERKGNRLQPTFYARLLINEFLNGFYAVSRVPPPAACARNGLVVCGCKRLPERFSEFSAAAGMFDEVLFVINGEECSLDAFLICEELSGRIPCLVVKNPLRESALTQLLLGALLARARSICGLPSGCTFELSQLRGLLKTTRNDAVIGYYENDEDFLVLGDKEEILRRLTQLDPRKHDLSTILDAKIDLKKSINRGALEL